MPQRSGGHKPAPRQNLKGHAARPKSWQRQPPVAAAEPVAAAQAAGLIYVSDSLPGITRKRSGKTFRYSAPGGMPITDTAELRRIRSLAVPPAYSDVWICPLPNGHLQATGRDARKRKQYRYHPRWREVRDETKYGRMLQFGEALPRIRQSVERDLRLPGLPRQKVLATVVRLLESTAIRVGNEEYARSNRSFGLTTLRDKHVDVKGAQLRFSFRGKSGKDHKLELNDRRLADIVRRCQDLPGQDLFQYVDEQDIRRTVTSTDINDYLRGICGQDFTAKDFRTWIGTVVCALALCSLESDSAAPSKTKMAQAIKIVSDTLGNTPAICKKCYVHPHVLQAYLQRGLHPLPGLNNRSRSTGNKLRPGEAAVHAFLKKRLATL